MIWRWCSKSPRWGISQSYRNFEMFGGFPTISSQTQVVWGLDILQLQESVSHSEGPIPEWRSMRLYCARVKTWWVYESLLLMDWWPSHNIHVAHMVLSGGNYRYIYIYMCDICIIIILLLLLWVIMYHQGLSDNCGETKRTLYVAPFSPWQFGKFGVSPIFRHQQPSRRLLGRIKPTPQLP